MDGSLILEFQTLEDAQTALAVINQIAAAWWQSQGFTVEDGELVGKNAKTGEDAPDKARTTTWDIVQESPDGTFYFSSLSNDLRFVDWRDYLPEGVVMPDDIECPVEWYEELRNDETILHHAKYSVVS